MRYLNLMPLMSFAMLYSLNAGATDNIGEKMIGMSAPNTISTDYWTPERLANAKPFPMPQMTQDKVKEIKLEKLGEPTFEDGMPPDINAKPNFKRITNVKYNGKDNMLLDRGTFKFPYSSSRLIPLSADLTYPYRAVGKLFFTKPGVGDFVCSASVLKPRIIVTAGHCVHQGSNGVQGFYTNFLFIPAYRDGVAPFQIWRYNYVATNTTWASSGGVPNAADYGMLELEDHYINDATRKISYYTGYFGYQTLSLHPNHAHLLGYPCNLDSCNKMHQVTAQSARVIAPNCVEYGSDMLGGSSGGPWVQNFGEYANGQTGGTNAGLNRIIGVTSYLYVNSDYKAEGASLPDYRFTSLLSFICNHRTGNC